MQMISLYSIVYYIFYINLILDSILRGIHARTDLGIGTGIYTYLCTSIPDRTEHNCTSILYTMLEFMNRNLQF